MHLFRIYHSSFIIPHSSFRYSTENHRLTVGFGLHEHCRAGRDGRGERYGLGVDACAVLVHHVVFPVEGGIAGKRVAHQVPAGVEVKKLYLQMKTKDDTIVTYDILTQLLIAKSLSA